MISSVRHLTQHCLLASILLLPTIQSLWSQNKVDARHLYERVLAIVPLVGQGTWADPIRPAGVPTPDQIKPGDRSGLLGFHMEMSDDGKVALVELVFANRQTMAPALAALLAQPAAKAFNKGRDKREDIEQEFKRYKKAFDLDKFGARVQ